MSTLKAEVVEISAVNQHPNADRLDLVRLKGLDWVVVAGREEPGTQPRYKVGDVAIYLPIDSVLPPKLECHLFPPGSKVTLSKSRLKTIKLRGCISQGMIINLNPDMYPELSTAKVGDDVTNILGIVKYEPPESGTPQQMQGAAKPQANALFKKYTDIENFKNYPNAFDGLTVYVSEKLHGTSARYAYLPKTPRNLLERILLFFRLLPTTEFCFGSRRVQLQEKSKDHKVFYDENVYGIMVAKYDLKQKLKVGEALYGEIIGDGIQGGYNYGHKHGEYSFHAYDLQRNGKYVNSIDFMHWCRENDIPMVPFEYVGTFDREVLDNCRKGASHLNQPIKEGIVIKTSEESIDPRFGRCILKWINDQYLLADQTDFH